MADFKKKKPKDSKDDKDSVDVDIIIQANKETQHLIDFMKFYYFLASFNAVEQFGVSERGAYIMPYAILSSMGYGFNKEQDTLCIHLNGFLAEIIPKLQATNFLICEKGVTVRFQPLKFGEFQLPSLLLHFRMFNTPLYEKAKKASYCVFTEIDESLIKDGAYKVKKVFNPAVQVDDKKEKTVEQASNIKRLF